ncbi:MAG: hypothetical protein KKD44_29450 [Proteobacteria bacterium]|nr:hypothetical protein [Pseudomonadota bacterium]
MAKVKRKKPKQRFRSTEILEVAKPSRVHDDTDHLNRPFEEGKVLDVDVTGLDGEQVGEPYYDPKIEDYRYVIKDRNTGGVVAVPQDRLRNANGRNRKTYGYSPSYSRAFERIFCQRRRIENGEHR